MFREDVETGWRAGPVFILSMWFLSILLCNILVFLGLVLQFLILLHTIRRFGAWVKLILLNFFPAFVGLLRSLEYIVEFRAMSCFFSGLSRSSGCGTEPRPVMTIPQP